MEFGMSCCCGGGITFDWYRGMDGTQVEPHSALSDHTFAWTPITGGLRFDCDITTATGSATRYSMKAKPIRYTFSSSNFRGSWETQSLAGCRATGPPKKHVSSVSLTRIIIPAVAVMFGPTIHFSGFGTNSGAGTYTRAVEVFKNGSSVGLYMLDAGVTVWPYTNTTNAFNPPVTIDLGFELSVGPSDVISCDVYIDFKTANKTGFDVSRTTINQWAQAFATPQYSGLQEGFTAWRFDGAKSRFNLDRLSHYRFAFSDHGPGVSTLEIKPQAGWTYSAVGSSVNLLKNDVIYNVAAFFGCEIPYIEVSIYAEASLTVTAAMRYTPADSGDYAAQQYRGLRPPGTFSPYTRGSWNKNAATVFSNRARRRNSGTISFAQQPYTAIESDSAPFANFPTSVTLERIP